MSSPLHEPQLIQCPYNESHIIDPHRMAKHLLKCRKAHPNVEQVNCPFNNTHRLPKPELQWHCENCVDRGQIDKEVFQREDIEVNKFPIPTAPVVDEEDWDSANNPSYDPIEYAKKAPVLRQVNDAPQSVRRGFRMQERSRLGNYDETKEMMQSESFGEIRRPVLDRDLSRELPQSSIPKGRGRLNKAL